jgi:hypothetical protein
VVLAGELEAGMGDPQVLSFRPEPGQFAWTFGGAAPVARIAPGSVLEVWTEDCDTNYTSVAKLRKDYLPGGTTAMRGAHRQLREIAAAYRGR